MRKRNEFPVGYLICINCGGPALWLINDIRHNKSPSKEDNIDVDFKYRLVNMKHPHYDPEELGYFLCDDCGGEIPEDNYASKYLIFMDDEDMITTNN